MRTEEPKKKLILDAKNPLLSAREFLATLRTADGDDTLWNYAGEFYGWHGAAYRPKEAEEVRKAVYRFLEEAYTLEKRGDEVEEVAFSPTKAKVDGVMDAMRAETFLRAAVPMPTWLDAREVDPRECLPCANGIIHLPTYVHQGRHYHESPTPLFFGTCSLPFDFTPDAPTPATWLAFMNQIFDGDQEQVKLLQEWAGYILTPDIRQHKMLLMVGPKRGGKGTTGRILTKLVGAGNVANPTLASLTTNFGLSPLLNKTLAIVGDARLSGRSDSTIVTERLLSISGGDGITIDRKNREPVTQQLPTRIMLLTNELPRLTDASGALASRFLILRLRKSFYGQEDVFLEERLTAELPGIALWAIEGWKRLREQGRFTVPQSSIDAVRELDEIGSPVMAFVRECCTIQAGARSYVDDVFQTWVNWCAEQGRDHPGSKQIFGRDLAAACPGVEIIQHRSGGVRMRSYEGLGLGASTGGGL